MSDSIDSEASGRSILLVDDDATFCERAARALRDRGYRVRTALNASDGWQATTVEAPEFAVLDLRMPGRSGLELASDLRRAFPGIKIVLLTGLAKPDDRDARDLQMALLRKPADVDDILAALGLL